MSFFRTVFALCAHFQSFRAICDVTVIASLRYLAKLVLLLTLLTLLALVPAGLNRVDTFAQWADQHLPAFAIKDSRVTTAVAQPYRADFGQLRFILDTTGATSQPDTNAPQGLLIEADSFMFWMTSTNGLSPVTHAQRSSLHGFPDGTVNGNYLRQMFRSFLWVGGPVLWIMFAVVAFLIILMHAVVFSGFAAMMERGAQRALSLRQLLNISIHAATPAVLVNAAFIALQLENVNLWWLYLIVYGIYLIGAVSASRDPAPEDVTGPDNFL